MPTHSLIDYKEAVTTAGFRLHTFEILNWGTFNRHAWTLPVQGGDSLLTGDIGSGKSTLVDGITTLLVPPQRVVYNKAAGADTRERDLRSYVMGYYKSEKNAETLEASSVALRDQNSYSVLAARFFNSGYKSTVTLAMVLWLPDKSRQPERFYVVAEDSLCIKNDFSGFGPDISQLRKKLKKQKKVSLFDSFSQYCAAFMRKMGIENSQALNLFFQTVSMKSVGNLTEFVRNHMLEAPPVGERIETLCRQFEDLNKAHEAVRRARDQVERLGPLKSECLNYTEIITAIERHQNYRSVLHSFFAEKKVRLLNDQISHYKTEEEKRTAQVTHIRQRLESLKLHEHDLRQAIYENGGNRLESIGNEINRLVVERNQIRQLAEKYLKLCRDLELPKPTTDSGFYENRQTAETRLIEVDAMVAEQENIQVETKVQLKQLGQNISELEAELDSLKKRKSNIPLKNITIRRKLCDSLGVPEQTIPFCGELLRIKESEKAWEGAAERLLHSFGLSLLIPEEIYAGVASYVDLNHLDGRIVYFKTVLKEEYENKDTDSNALCRKLEIKPETLFYDWLSNELSIRFNAICCDDMTAFQRVNFGITRQGQVKSGGKRHEKDDRFSIADKSRFILGWQNLEKIKALTRDLNELQGKWNQGIKVLEQSGKERDKLRILEKKLRNLLLTQSFTEIYWQPVALKIKQLSEEKEALQQSTDILKTLQTQVADNQVEITKLEKQKDQINELMGKIQVSLKNWHDNRKESFARFNEIPQNTRDLLFPELVILQQEAIGDAQITIKNCDNRQTEMRNWLQRRLDSMDGKKNRLAQNIVKMMQEYKNIYPMETRETDATVEAMDEYIAMLDTLLSEDLPRHESRFKTMLNEGTIQNMALFQSKLESELADIRDKIKIINLSLSAIDYNENTFIELMADQSRDTEVRQFRQELKACLVGTLTGKADEDYNEQKFMQVKGIINRFKGREGRADLDNRWTKKVTDVRNWLMFSASERWRADDAEKEFFSDTSGKSGGQKEKLAYTILAAALAYQFGLKWGEKRSHTFRFVMIDEAFGRGSDESTRYALELFKKLDLQLLIVTPMQKTHIIEEYVQSVHFIHNADGKNSMIRNLTIEEYKEEKITYQQKEKIV